MKQVATYILTLCAAACVLAAAAVRLCVAETPALKCNGSPLLCDKRYDQVVFPATHNSTSNIEDKWKFPNHFFPVSRQLEDGIRGLNIDLFSYQGDIYTCHTYCAFGNKKLSGVLADIKKFMDQNPGEVVTIFLEYYEGSARVPELIAESGLAALALPHKKGEQWPTLRQMIESGRRLVVFSTDAADPAKYPWYLSTREFSVWSPYFAEKPKELSCGSGLIKRADQIYVMPNFLTNPVANPELAKKVNFESFLTRRTSKCAEAVGAVPNFIQIDFYSIGDLIGTVRKLNGIQE